jgi:hypothetical protein
VHFRGLRSGFLCRKGTFLCGFVASDLISDPFFVVVSFLVYGSARRFFLAKFPALPSL